MELVQCAAMALETPPLAKCFAQDLWLAECCIGPDGAVVFHVETLAEALRTNLVQIVRGWSANYVPFALVESVEAARAACDAMRQLQERFKAAEDERAARES